MTFSYVPHYHELLMNSSHRYAADEVIKVVIANLYSFPTTTATTTNQATSFLSLSMFYLVCTFGS